MHTVWKGNLSFGLINIGIKLHSAIEDKDVKLIGIHKDCLVPIQYEKVAPGCEEGPVEPEDIVKAYQYGANKYVIVSEEELRNLKQEYEVESVDLISFVQLEEIDPIYFERSYFINPMEGSERTYVLLRQALERTGKIGIVKISLRSRQHLAIIRVYKHGLILETIHYPDEVRSIQQVPNLPSEEQVTIQMKELIAATTLINQLTVPFVPEDYKDEYRTALLDLIETKIEKEDVQVKSVINPNKENIISIMEALNKSIEQTKPEKSPKVKSTSKTKKATS
ncbi:Ku protein [Peribacillus asahii]|uniref:Non-homologous end joining protein Ku n=1 Tax=Peribacillus asahii TaxID=228899 RepID=A0A3T0KU86_9BACI|nr:Ku protein [Peribacillus asahii]AZV44002.1 DNA repair protein [Peribacillus asahii]USK83737.1 Ku protein [Peribacillus asahii]